MFGSPYGTLASERSGNLVRPETRAEPEPQGVRDNHETPAVHTQRAKALRTNERPQRPETTAACMATRALFERTFKTIYTTAMIASASISNAYGSGMLMKLPVLPTASSMDSS